MKKLFFSPAAIIVSAGLFGIAATVIAEPGKSKLTPQEQEEYQRKLFKQIDADGDKKITEREFAVIVLWDEFKSADSNNDGKVTKAEYDEIKNKQKNLWSQLDTKGNGYVTFEDCCKSPAIIKELRDEWKKLLAKIGKSGASYLTVDDLPDLTP